MTNKAKALLQVERNFASRGIVLDADTIEALRRCEMVLQRWAEEECGNSDNYKAWSIERDEETNKPYRVTHYYSGTVNTIFRRAVADREAGALKRVATICKAHGLHFYHQTDCRGVMLYVAKEPLTDQNYSSIGAACNA